MEKVKRKHISHRGPRLGLWLCFISIQCSVQGAFGCQNVDNLSLSVYPEGTIHVPLGKRLELYCIDDKSKADDLEFAIGGVSNPSQEVNGTTRRLSKEMHEKGVFAYYCVNKVTNKKCPTRVVVDSPPQNVTDFACKSKNLEVLNCTWTTAPQRVSVTNYSLSFIINGNKVSSCKAQKVDASQHFSVPTRYFCSWNTSSVPRYRQQEERFHFNLKFVNVFGKNEQNFEVDHFRIVQPEKVSKLRIIENATHSVLLQWSIPINMATLMPRGVVHKIEYQIAKIDNTSYFRSVDASSLPTNNNTYKFLLSNLPYAHMRYEVRIYIRPTVATSDEFWSDYNFLLFYTASERPNRPPDTVTGAFDQSIFESKRRIYVYWRQLEEYEEAGANFTYKVVAYEDSKNPQTLMPDSQKRGFVILDSASLGPISIKIWSMNDNGSSVNHSHLYIPSMKDTESLKVPSFTKLAYENGTYKLSWVSNTQRIDNYTLFWCQDNSTKICTGRMNFTVLNQADTEHVIDLPKENRYQFAISANKDAKTSGMVWATCDISKDGIPMYGFPVKLDHGIAGPTHVKITWTMSCTLQEGIIKGYLISYCPVINTSSVCDETFENKSSVYISNPKQMEMNITNLKPYRTYLFKLALNTTYGLKKIENASTGVTTTEDTPTEPRKVSITDIQNDSVSISWDPPLHKNGIIWKYKIYNNSNVFTEFLVPDNDKDLVRRHLKLTGLEAFQNYSWSISACITGIQKCSIRSPLMGIFIRTRIGNPSKMRPPEILNNPDRVQINHLPTNPGGTIDQYQIMRIRDDEKVGDTFNITNLTLDLDHCQGSVKSEKYLVRAVNFDEDLYHGALASLDQNEVELPARQDNTRLEFPGEWSDPISVACRSKDGITMTLILMAVGVLVGVMYGSTKFYKKYRKMEDIKPVLPDGLGIPEKDVSKYAYGGWNPSSKDEKPSSDEVLLLPNSRGTTVSTDTKQKDDTNCGSSDHTNSTVLSDTSRGAIDRQASTSDDGSSSSLHLEIEAVKGDGDNASPDDEDSSNSDVEPSRENSPYFSNKEFKINPMSGYVQQPVASPAMGYVQSAPAPPPVKSPSAQPASSSYVMAALSPPIFTTGVSPPSLRGHLPPTGYVRPEDAHSRSMLNFANSNLSPTKLFGPESLPTMPTLPLAAKHGGDSSYIQLQSLDALPGQKAVRSAPPPKPTAATSGYVSPGDAVISKHLNNMLSGQLAEESAMIDPMMSPDAYCRFSWSTDPANDNLHSLLADSPVIKPSKN